MPRDAVSRTAHVERTGYKRIPYVQEMMQKTRLQRLKNEVKKKIEEINENLTKTPQKNTREDQIDKHFRSL